VGGGWQRFDWRWMSVIGGEKEGEWRGLGGERERGWRRG
jgi:hypothetical protein